MYKLKAREEKEKGLRYIRVPYHQTWFPRTCMRSVTRLRSDV